MIVKLNKETTIGIKTYPKGAVLNVTNDLGRTLDCDVLTEDGHVGTSKNHKFKADEAIAKQNLKHAKSKNQEGVGDPAG